MQPAGPEPATERINAISEQHQRNRGRQGKTAPRRQCADIPRSQQANRYADLAAGRPWKKLTERDKIGICAFIKPSATDDIFVRKISEMGDWSAKRCETE